MEKAYIKQRAFTEENFAAHPLLPGEYDRCSFQQCAFIKSDLKGITFTECTFTGCDFSLARLLTTAFRDVSFTDCKLMGLHFDECAPFALSFTFDQCMLSYSSFFQLKIRGTRFIRCKLEEVDFGQTDLTQAVFSDCDLSRAVFNQTLLEQADFRTAFGFAIDPEKNRIRKARFSSTNVAGLLAKYQLQID